MKTCGFGILQASCHLLSRFTGLAELIHSAHHDHRGRLALHSVDGQWRPTPPAQQQLDAVANKMLKIDGLAMYWHHGGDAVGGPVKEAGIQLALLSLLALCPCSWQCVWYLSGLNGSCLSVEYHKTIQLCNAGLGYREHLYVAWLVGLLHLRHTRTSANLKQFQMNARAF